jgi:hypothetical protein
VKTSNLTGNISFENVPQFKYLEMAVINQNLIQEELKNRLDSPNACYHSVQNLSPSRLQGRLTLIRKNCYEVRIQPER